MLYWKRNDQGQTIDEHFIYIVFCHTSLAVLLIDHITSEQCHEWQLRRIRKKVRNLVSQSGRIDTFMRLILN